jgi:hypothetical protein
MNDIADRLEAFIPDGDGYNSEYAHTLQEAVDALRAKPVVPDGYVLVPVEPTRAMIASTDGEFMPPVLVYKTMLKAAAKEVV